MDEIKNRTVFITNRGGTHPNRVKYFSSIGADFQFVDFFLPWHGITNSKLRMIVSGIICAIFFPKRKHYSLFVTSDLQLPAILMKKLGLLRQDQRVVSYLGSQTLYFIESRYFSRLTRLYYKFLLQNYDAHICNGELQAFLLQKVVQVSQERIHINFNGISNEKKKKLTQVVYHPNNINFLFIGNIYSDWRIYYKGLDLVLSSFALIKKYNQKFTLTIVGKSHESVSKLITDRIEPKYFKDIKIAGVVDDISMYLSSSLLYIHPSRGDALPNALIEALFAGIPAVVTNLTGGHEMVKQIDEKLVCKPQANDVADAIMHFIRLPEITKVNYSNKARRLTVDLTENAAIERFQKIIDEIITS